MQEATQILDELNVAYHVEVVSAHRTPDKLFEFAENAQKNGYKVNYCGCGWRCSFTRYDCSQNACARIGCPC